MHICGAAEALLKLQHGIVSSTILGAEHATERLTSRRTKYARRDA
jgi:hypothetical protein